MGERNPAPLARWIHTIRLQRLAPALAALSRAARDALEGQADAARDLELRLGYAVYPADGNDPDALERAVRARSHTTSLGAPGRRRLMARRRITTSHSRIAARSASSNTRTMLSL